MVRALSVVKHELHYNGELIRRRIDGTVNLTDMWKAAGSPPNKEPPQWERLPTTSELIRVLEENMGFSHVLQKQRGRTGGSMGHPLVAVSYARYLSPEFHVWANHVILQRIEERGNPELGLTRMRDRAIEFWRSKGKPDAWIRQRLNSINVRHQFTDALKAHGIAEGWEYAACTDAIYKPLLGDVAKDVRRKRDLPPSANLRDHLNVPELAAVALSESVAEQGIIEQSLRGASKCREACSASSKAVARAVADAKRVIAELGGQDEE